MSQQWSPLQAEQQSLEAEERAMKKGKGRMIAAMVAAVLAVVGVVVFLLLPNDGDAYEKLGRNINRLDAEHFDQFWACALQGADVAGFRNDGELRTQLNLRASRGGKRYGQHLRDSCLPKLADFGPNLQALIPPDDLQAPLRDLVASVDALRGATSDYAGYLDGLEGPYDEDDATPQVTAVARGWYEYRVKYGAVNDAIRAKLGR